jgi:dTDP-4-dehydrorhamnose reductase
MTARRALITGAGGQLAIELERWAPGHFEVTSLDIERLDITSAAQIDNALAACRPEVVFNTAAYTAVDLAEKESDAADRVNHRAVDLLRAACDGFGARLVHVSTDYVFDGLSPRPYLPGDPTDPQSVYGRTKRDGEIAALRSASSLVVRTAWLYGAHGKNFMRTMIKLMQERDEVRVVADQVGTPTTAAGLARALWSLSAKGATGIHHWTDAGVASWYDFAVAIREEAAAVGLGTERARVTPIRTVDYPTPARRPAMSVLAKDATWSLLGGPGVHWRDGLRETISEYASTSQAHPLAASTKGAA